MEKSYITNMLSRLPDLRPKFVNHLVNGVNCGYNDCCVVLFDRLLKAGISPGLFMNYWFGEDIPGIQHVRCPECRVYCGPPNLGKFVAKVRRSDAVCDIIYEKIKEDLGRHIRTLVSLCGYPERGCYNA